jgi:hypothetical protein
MRNKFPVLIALICIVFFILSQLPSMAKDITLVPALTFKVEYDDNIDFDSDSEDEIDGFSGSVIPEFTINYATELLKFNSIAQVDVKRYLDETDFDRTNLLGGIDGSYRMFPRWTLTGNFLFRKDKTTDSQLEETGRVFDRDTSRQYDAGSGLFYQLTELSDLGFDFFYRKRDFSGGDNTDYDAYTFSLPYTKRFANQRDTITLEPSYTIFDSDEEDAKDYRFSTGWKRLISETLTSEINVGGRYTEIDNNGDDDNSFGYFGELSLRKKGETFSGLIGISRDLRGDTDGNIIEVNRLQLRADKRLSERFGFRFYGSGYLSTEEADNNNDNGDKVRFFELRPSLYFLITENHTLDLVYSYQNEEELDEPGNPVTQRNRAWLALTFRFPKKW